MQDVGGVAARAGRLRGRRGCRRRQLPRRPPEKGGIVGDPERQPDIRASDTVTGLTPAPPCPRAAQVRAARVQDTRVRVLTCDAHTLCTSRTPRGPRPDAPAPPSAPKVELPTGGGGSLCCCVGDTGAACRHRSSRYACPVCGSLAPPPGGSWAGAGAGRARGCLTRREARGGVATQTSLTFSVLPRHRTRNNSAPPFAAA